MPVATHSPESTDTRRFAGASIEEALGAAAAALGSDLEVVDARRLRKGGVGGFFARETYEVVARRGADRAPHRPVDLPAAEPMVDLREAAPPAPRRFRDEDLVPIASTAGTAATHAGPADTAHDGAAARRRIDAVLASLIDEIDEREQPGPRPEPVLDIRTAEIDLDFDATMAPGIEDAADEPGDDDDIVDIEVLDVDDLPMPDPTRRDPRLVSLSDDCFWADKVSAARRDVAELPPAPAAPTAETSIVPGPIAETPIAHGPIAAAAPAASAAAPAPEAAPAVPAGTEWSRTALADAGVPRAILRRLPAEDPVTELGWMAALEAALAAVVPAPAEPGAAPLVADAAGPDGVIALLRAVVEHGAVPGRLHLDGRAVPATATELTLALRRAITA